MAKKKNKTRRIVFILIGVVIVLAILGVVAVQFMNRGNQGTMVETVTAEIRTLTQIVTASGKVQPEVEVLISPDVSGEVIQLTVKEGDRVTQGNLLARIKPDFYAAQVEQAEANVMQSKATQAQRLADMINAEAEMTRMKTLFEKQAVSESEYQQVQTQYEIAKAAQDAAQYAVQSAEARLREAQEQLSKTALYAPMSGTVSKLDIELGERVVGTGQMTGTEMMRIAKLDQMELEVDVNENDVVNVSLGDTAAIEVDAYPDGTFKGIVTEIANSARVTAAGTQEQVTNFPVKIRILDFHNIDARDLEAGQGNANLNRELPVGAAEYPNFRPGMSGTVDIFTKTVANVIAIPIQAVTVRDFNKVKPGIGEEAAEEEEAEEEEEAFFVEEDLRRVVFLLEEEKARMLEVETGIADDLYIEIKTGLSGGETIITGPFSVVSRTLEPGDSVRKRDPRLSRLTASGGASN